MITYSNGLFALIINGKKVFESKSLAFIARMKEAWA